MDKFDFQLVSPDRVVFSGKVGSVLLPAIEGEMTVMANHAPFMSNLKNGIIIVDSDKKIFVKDGFVDVSSSCLTVLAEYANDVDVENLFKESENT